MWVLSECNAKLWITVQVYGRLAWLRSYLLLHPPEPGKSRPPPHPFATPFLLNPAKKLPRPAPKATTYLSACNSPLRQSGCLSIVGGDRLKGFVPTGIDCFFSLSTVDPDRPSFQSVVRNKIDQCFELFVPFFFVAGFRLLFWKRCRSMKN